MNIQVPKVFLVMAGLFLAIQIFGLIFVAAPDETIAVETDSLITETSSREDVAESSQIMEQLKFVFELYFRNEYFDARNKLFFFHFWHQNQISLC